MNNIVTSNMINNLLDNKVVKEMEAKNILALNEKTDRFNLTLTESEAYDLVETKVKAVFDNELFEFDNEVINKIIMEFVDSPYMDRETYAETLNELVDMYYEYRVVYGSFMRDEVILEALHYQFDKYGIVSLLDDEDVKIIKHNVTHKLPWNFVTNNTVINKMEDGVISE